MGFSSDSTHLFNISMKLLTALVVISLMNTKLDSNPKVNTGRNNCTPQIRWQNVK